MPKSGLAAPHVVLAFCLLLAGCGDSQKQGQNAPPPPTVTVAKPAKRTIVDQDEYVGRFVAVDAIEVRARVSGYLEKVHFKDGQVVNQGDPLFSIDARPFENALAQARANLTQAQASLTFAQGDLVRAQQLVREKAIAEQVFEQRALAQRNAQAAVAANEALVRQAELDMQFTALKAPMTGRIGDRRVSPGNLVTGGTQGNTTLLATIVTLDPVRFEFTFDEASFLRYQRLSSDGTNMAYRKNVVPVNLKLLDEGDFSHEGRMDFVDNVIERSSGTIRGRALFDNPKNLFIPGMFARIRLPASAPYEALLVPDSAVGTEQARKFVLAVAADGTANPKYVTLGEVVDNMRVIKNGIAADDRIIVNGMMLARPGSKVTAQEEGAPSAAPAPQAKK